MFSRNDKSGFAQQGLINLHLKLVFTIVAGPVKNEVMVCELAKSFLTLKKGGIMF